MDLQQLIAFVKEAQGPLNWDSASLIRVGGQLAAKVNSIQNLSGQEKQKLICQILKTVLEDVEKKELVQAAEEKKAEIVQQFASLKKTVEEVLPASLDLALAAARGKLDLKKVKMSVWVKYFSCCAKSVVTALVSNNVISQAQAKQATDALAAVEAKASEAAAAPDSAGAGGEAPAKEEDKTKFEQENPMRTAIQEEAKKESQSEESSSTA